MSEFIPYSRQTIEEDDIQAVADVLRTNYLTTGPKVGEFENAVAKYVEATFAVAFTSGTAALHGAMYAAGLGPCDEVLVPTMSFLATANAVHYLGAKAIFVDSLADGFNIDVEDARRKLTSRTKAIVPVHFAGQPVDLAAIHALAKEHKLLVIEDAAHALGAKHQSKPIGGLSDMTIFSFHPVKQITTGEGGMVTTTREDLAKRLRQFRHHGISMDVIERDKQQLWAYDMTALGFNYRLTDFQCALGISQLKKSERFLQDRERVVSQYDAAFSKLPFVKLPPHASAQDRHAWHLYILRLDTKMLGQSRDEIFQHLRAKQIGVHVHYRPIHLHTFYTKQGWKEGDCPNIESTFSSILTLPCFPAMTTEMVARVTEAISTLPSALIQGGSHAH